MIASPTMTHRERLIELLRRLFDTHTDTHTAADEAEIIDIVYRHLHDELRPRLLAKFGAQVGEGGASTRFTELLNRFFVKVMEAFPDGMQRVQTRRKLSNYVSMAMQRMIYEHHRGKREQACGDESLLDCLIEESRQRFQSDCGSVQYEDMEQIIRAWEQSGDPLRQKWARLIRYRYFLGETQQRTMRDMELSYERYKTLEQQALDQLRREVE